MVPTQQVSGWSLSPTSIGGLVVCGRAAFAFMHWWGRDLSIWGSWKTMYLSWRPFWSWVTSQCVYLTFLYPCNWRWTFWRCSWALLPRTFLWTSWTLKSHLPQNDSGGRATYAHRDYLSQLCRYDNNSLLGWHELVWSLLSHGPSSDALWATMQFWKTYSRLSKWTPCLENSWPRPWGAIPRDLQIEEFQKHLSIAIHLSEVLWANIGSSGAST